MNSFTAKDEDICSYTGLFGTLISLTCLIQHFVITRPHIISGGLAFIYVFSIFVFILLGLQKKIISVLLIINLVLVMLAELVLFRYRLFSVIVLLLCIYTMTITIYIYVDGLPARLSHNALEKRAERDQWRGKI